MTEVRPMRDTERDEVHALLAEAYHPYAHDMTPAMYAHYMKYVLNLDDGGAPFVAVTAGEVVGTARLFPAGRAPIPLPSDWAWVRAVGVRPSARGTGVGRALMTYSHEQAGPAAALALHTMSFMPVAVRLYERLGYVRSPEWDIQVGAKAGFPAEDTFLAVAYHLVK